MDTEKKIQHVAIYLRKSRDDDQYEDVLEKHRDTLTAIAESREWTYQLYEEIASGERIARRSVMQKLLRHVEERKFDGVLVMDIDRLGRGDHSDWAIICETFITAETYVITQQRIYDLNEEQDEMIFDFQAVFSKMEYKMIKKRMKQGKIAAAKKGQWVNGAPPYPYIYNRETREIEVPEEGKKIYRWMIELYLKGTNVTAIAKILNQNKITPPYGGKMHRNTHGWSNNTVIRLLLHEVHLGYIVYGKTKRIKDKVIRIKRENWIRVQGHHEILKSLEEHERILRKREAEILLTKKTVPLSGLMYCGKCGRRMILTRRGIRERDVWIAQCGNEYPDGRRCEQVGRVMDAQFFRELNKGIFQIDPETIEKWKKQYYPKLNENRMLLENAKIELTKVEKAISKLLDLYETGIVERETFEERIFCYKKIKKELTGNLQDSGRWMEKYGHRSPEDIVKRMEECKTKLKQARSSTEVNLAYKELLERIYYDRKIEQIILIICLK